jgi:hypothetical protein
MAVVCEQYGGYEESYTDGQWQITLKYNIRGVLPSGPPDNLSSEDVAVNLLLVNSPSTYNTLYRTSYRLVKMPSVSGMFFQGEVTYSSSKLEQWIGSVIIFRGRTERVKRMYAPVVDARGDIGSEFTASVLNGAVNVDEHGVPQGMDVPIPVGEMTIQVRVPKNTVTIQNCFSWYGLQTLCNSDNWGAFAPGDVQFLDFSFQSGTGQNDQVEFMFSLAPTEQFTDADIPIVGTTPLVKRGHDYLSIGWRQYFNPDAKFLGSRIEYVSVHRPFRHLPFTGAFRYAGGSGGGLIDIITLAMVSNLS